MLHKTNAQPLQYTALTFLHIPNTETSKSSCLRYGLKQDWINSSNSALEKDLRSCAFSVFQHVLVTHAHAAPHRKCFTLYSTSNVHSAELPFTYSMAYFSVHSFAILLYLTEHGVLEKEVCSLLLHSHASPPTVVLALSLKINLRFPQTTFFFSFFYNCKMMFNEGLIWTVMICIQTGCFNHILIRAIIDSSSKSIIRFH